MAPAEVFGRRTAGVLLHPTSLSGSASRAGDWGCGTLGAEARHFVRFLERAGQTWWQMLPIHPPDGCGSPYGTSSCCAGSPLLIDPEELRRAGLLSRAEWERSRLPAAKRVDHARTALARERVLRAAFARFVTPGEAGEAGRAQLAAFRKAHAWVHDHALFSALKRAHGGLPWTQWPAALRRRAPAALRAAEREHGRELDYHVFVQHCFQTQWLALRSYATERGIRLFGDLPLYVGHDSADVWAHQGLFALRKNGLPACEAGTPPDYFSAEGQRWGMPVYRWEAHARERYHWWRQRVARELELFDALRLDHFLGYARFWRFPAHDSPGVHGPGKYEPGPGRELFRALQRAHGPLPFAAEDLGDVTPEAEALRDEFGFPGMRILQFAFDGWPGENHHLPHHFTRTSIAYTGTHDNDTTRGWFAKRRGAPARRAVLDYAGGTAREVPWSLIRLAHESVANTAIVPMQDLLELGSRERMNVPGTAHGNWGWRLQPGRANARLADRLARLTSISGRWR